MQAARRCCAVRGSCLEDEVQRLRAELAVWRTSRGPKRPWLEERELTAAHEAARVFGGDLRGEDGRKYVVIRRISMGFDGFRVDGV